MSFQLSICDLQWEDHPWLPQTHGRPALPHHMPFKAGLCSGCNSSLLSQVTTCFLCVISHGNTTWHDVIKGTQCGGSHEKERMHFPDQLIGLHSSCHREAPKHLRWKLANLVCSNVFCPFPLKAKLTTVRECYRLPPSNCDLVRFHKPHKVGAGYILG